MRKYTVTSSGKPLTPDLEKNQAYSLAQELADAGGKSVYVSEVGSHNISVRVRPSQGSN